jgi:N-hydroxyarylamine O-acetyltransferase
MCGSLTRDYLDRLGLREQDLEEEPTLEKLAAIQEAHLNCTPFENLAQHGCDRPACLDIEATARKVLHVKRGGFCFELNALLSEFLSRVGLITLLGYLQLFTILKKHRFNRSPSHLGVFCNIDNIIYFVDVAFGEPAIHPLVLEMNVERTTAEGMISRFVGAANPG